VEDYGFFLLILCAQALIAEQKPEETNTNAGELYLQVSSVFHLKYPIESTSRAVLKFVSVIFYIRIWFCICKKKFKYSVLCIALFRDYHFLCDIQYDVCHRSFLTTTLTDYF